MNANYDSRHIVKTNSMLSFQHFCASYFYWTVHHLDS